MEPERGQLTRQRHTASYQLPGGTGDPTAAAEFKINKSMAHKGREQENELRQAKRPSVSRRRGGGVGRAAGGRSKEQRRVSPAPIPLTAIIIHEHFRGGPSWCFPFMKRRHLSIRNFSRFQ